MKEELRCTKILYQIWYSGKGGVKAAQKTCDRFLNGIREIAVAEKLETTVRDLIALVVGDEFDFSTEGVWSWNFLPS